MSLVQTLLNRLNRYDFNTLLALDALLELRHVSQAAERMNISQPAMSRILAKLRDAFDDPLLLRIHGQHLLTERGLSLQQPLKRILHDIDELLHPPLFDPATCRRTFRIALTDFSAQVFLPEILHHVYKQAPEVTIETTSLRVGMLNTASFDRIDVSICSPQYYGPCDLHSHALFTVPTAVLMAKSHPLARCKLTLDAFLKYPHVEIDLGGNEGTLIDELLQQQGHRRRIGLRSTHVTSVLPIVEKTELLFSTAWELLAESSKNYELIDKPIPLNLPLSEYSVLWHPKDQNSPANTWLRELLIRAARKESRIRV